MEWARIGGLALTGLTALLILRSYKPDWAPLIRLAVAVIFLGITLTMVATVLDYVQELTSATGALSEETWPLLLKALGIAFLTETAASLCRDSGEAGLAGWVETAGRLEILLLSFPLIRTVMETVTALLAGR
jgi:stage III sporulation protein AD